MLKKQFPDIEFTLVNIKHCSTQFEFELIFKDSTQFKNIQMVLDEKYNNQDIPPDDKLIEN